MSTTSTPRTYNEALATAPSATTPFPELALSAMEIVKFFPNHTQYPEILFRLLRSGWDAPTIAKAQLHARDSGGDVLTAANKQRRAAAIRKQIQTAGEEKFGNQWTGMSGNFAMYAPELMPIQKVNYNPPEDIESYYHPENMVKTNRKGGALGPPATLRDLYSGITNPPQGDDAGQLTQSLIYCNQNGWEKPDGEPYTTDDIWECFTFLPKPLAMSPSAVWGDYWDQDSRDRAQAIPEPPKTPRTANTSGADEQEDGEGEEKDGEEETDEE